MTTNLTPFEQRRLLRIALGSCLGFSLCKIMDWPYGVFFAVFPMLLLGMVPVFNRMVAIQFVAGTLINIVEIWALKVALDPYPTLMIAAVFFVYGYHFRFMAGTPYFLMWASGLVTISTVLHFSSYPDTSMNDMLVSTMLATLISVFGAVVLYWIIPEHETVAPPPKLQLTHSQLNHRTLLGATLATLSYIIFQVFDLRDSLSAQVATMLILFPMTYQGSIGSAINRAKGVAYGCALAITMQLLMNDLIEHFALVVIAMFMTVMIAAKLHLLERAGSAVGFGALTTIGILFGQYLSPHSDIVYSAAYRVTSVVVAITVVLMAAYLLDRFLNRFELTRN